MNDNLEGPHIDSPTHDSADDSPLHNASSDSATASVHAPYSDSPVKLFVGSLPYDVNEDDLLSIFSKFGEIIEFAILRDRNGRSRGCAALRFTTNEAAELCISTLHNRFCCGNVPTPLQVRYFEKRENIPVTCFLEGLPYCFAPHVLWTNMSTAYGPVSNVFLDAVNPFAAYVSFFKKSSAFALSSDSRAGKVCVGGMICPSLRVIVIKNAPSMMSPYGCYAPAPQFGYPVPPMAMPPIPTMPVPGNYQEEPDVEPTDPPMKLFVGCLPYSKTAQDIADLFSPYGTLIEVAILTDYAGKSRGAAFVTFSKNSEAQKAVEELRDFSFPKSTRCINISFAYKQTVWNNNRSSNVTLTENGTTASCTSSNAGEGQTPLSSDKQDHGLVSA